MTVNAQSADREVELEIVLAGEASRINYARASQTERQGSHQLRRG